jgi:hypothetical protein
MSKSQARPSRRAFFIGASAATAVVAVATATQKLGSSEQAEPQPEPTPERGGGYKLSEHVKRYYRTARV